MGSYGFFLGGEGFKWWMKELISAGSLGGSWWPGWWWRQVNLGRGGIWVWGFGSIWAGGRVMRVGLGGLGGGRDGSI